MKLRNFSVVVPTAGNQLFMLRRCAKHHIGMWEFPAGKGEPNETAVLAAVRELAEETGHSLADPGELKLVMTFFSETNHGGEHVNWSNNYFTTPVKRNDVKLMEPNTHDMCGWFTPQQAFDMYTGHRVVPIHALIIPCILMKDADA